MGEPEGLPDPQWVPEQGPPHSALPPKRWNQARGRRREQGGRNRREMGEGGNEGGK